MWSNTIFYSVKRLYTDNRREYIMLKLKSFLRKQGIIYKTSTLHMCQQIVIFSNWTVSCLKRHSQCNLKHTYQISDKDLQLQLQLMYTIVHLLDISNGKHIRRSSYVINLKHCTSISLTVKPICFFLVKFMLTSLYYIIALNW